jgi:hypothetical protein
LTDATQASPRAGARAGPGGWRGYALALAQVLCVAMSCAFAVLMAQWMFADPGEMGVAGDFTSFYAASELALEGRAAETYDEPPHFARQKALYRNQERGYLTFMYPPIFLLMCLPFALLPFVWMTAAWLVATNALYVAALFRLLPRPGLAVLLLGYPAVFTNAGYGQNGALSAALLGFAAWALDRRPALAGLCLGLLAYKPHLGLIVPLALAVTGRWRAFLAAAATVLALAAAASAVFGVEIWQAYLDRGPDMRRWLESDDVGYLDKWVTLYGAIRLHGGGLGLAYAAQAAVALAAGGALLASLRRRTEGAAIIAGVTAAIPFLSPFMLEYDLLVLAVPMAWLLGEGARGGFLRGEGAALAFAWLAPALFKISAWDNAVKLAVLASCAALFSAVLRRIRLA